MGYAEKRIDNFDILTVEEDGKIYTTVLFYGYHCGDFAGAVTGQTFKHGLLVKPIKGKESATNRTYCFYNNDGKEVFRTKRRMNESKTEFVETINFFEDPENVSYRKTSKDGSSYTRTFNIATNTEVVPGQLSLF